MPRYDVRYVRNKAEQTIAVDAPDPTQAVKVAAQMLGTREFVVLAVTRSLVPGSDPKSKA
jgi:hypothetical protein